MVTIAADALGIAEREHASEFARRKTLVEGRRGPGAVGSPAPRRSGVAAPDHGPPFGAIVDVGWLCPHPPPTWPVADGHQPVAGAAPRDASRSRPSQRHDPLRRRRKTPAVASDGPVAGRQSVPRGFGAEAQTPPTTCKNDRCERMPANRRVRSPNRWLSIPLAHFHDAPVRGAGMPVTPGRPLAWVGSTPGTIGGLGALIATKSAPRSPRFSPPARRRVAPRLPAIPGVPLPGPSRRCQNG